jgi:hypothetical protein
MGQIFSPQRASSIIAYTQGSVLYTLQVSNGSQQRKGQLSKRAHPFMVHISAITLFSKNNMETTAEQGTFARI